MARVGRWQLSRCMARVERWQLPRCLPSCCPMLPLLQRDKASVQAAAARQQGAAERLEAAAQQAQEWRLTAEVSQVVVITGWKFAMC
jgi:hypothetical protein